MSVSMESVPKKPKLIDLVDEEESKPVSSCSLSVPTPDSSSRTSLSLARTTGTGREVCVHGVNCYRKNPHHFREFSHPDLEKLLHRISSTRDVLENFANHKEEAAVFPKQDNVLDQLVILRQLGFDKDGRNEGTDVLQVVQVVSTPPPSSFKPETTIHKPPPPVSGNCQFSASSSRSSNKLLSGCSSGDMLSKWERSLPYNFFLLRLPSESDADHLVSFRDVFHPSLGTVKAVCHFNFQVEFEWLLEESISAGLEGKEIKIIYGTQTTEMMNGPKAFPWITAYHIKSPFPFGHHHTKMILIKYEDESMRFVIHTANLIQSDWNNHTQGAWIGPRCAPLSTANGASGESVTNFRNDLIQYLSTYPPKHVAPWINVIRNSNCSHIRVVFVGSAPVTMASSTNGFQWAQKKMEQRLRNCSSQIVKANWPLIIQCSSIGTLGQSDDWLRQEIAGHFCPSSSGITNTKASVHVIYPSHADVLASLDGIQGGNCLPYSATTHLKQPWFQNYLHKWKSDQLGRTRVTPHIKTYCRISPDFKQLAWFLVTSANLSKAAWGKMNKANTKLSVMSWEVGVLFLPKNFGSSDVFEIAKTKTLEDCSGSTPVPFRVPYDLPLTKYGARERPWFIESLLAEGSSDDE